MFTRDISDCYDRRMNLSNPILICDENEEFRILIRDMLTKNGFFHVLEAVNSNEANEILKNKTDYFVIIEAKALNHDTNLLLQKQKNFIVFADNSSPETILLSAKLGVNHVMSYPFHSRKLIDKINSLI
jgi:AmiR/NasT family two-component response regulator